MPNDHPSDREAIYVFHLLLELLVHQCVFLTFAALLKREIEVTRLNAAAI